MTNLLVDIFKLNMNSNINRAKIITFLSEVNYQVIHLCGEMMHFPSLGTGQHMFLAGYRNDIPSARFSSPHIRRPGEMQCSTTPTAHVTRT